MTRDQIIERWDTLTPRERDAWVARDVMGAEVIGGDVECVTDGFRPVPRYTTNISAALKVADRYWSFELRKGPDGRWWGCRIINEDEDVVSRASAVSAPEAICFAALKLTEVSK